MLKKIVKISWMALVSTIVLFNLSACQSVVLKSPTELIKPPKLDVDQEEVRQVIEEVLPDKTQLTSIVQKTDVGAINFIDLDGDEVDEAVAFYKSQEKDYLSGVIILKYGESGWEKFDEKKEIANDIESVSFEDVTQDGNKDILVGYIGDKDFDKYLVIYSIDKDEKIIRVFEKSYNELAIADFDYDDQIEIILFQLDRNVSAQAQLYESRNDKFFILDEYEINEYVSAYDNVVVGDLYKDDIGMVVDFRVGAKAAASIMLKVEHDRIVNVLDGENEKYYYEAKYKPYFIESDDIDNDGIIEIGNIIEPIGYEDISNLNTPYIEEWSVWDGDRKLKLDRQSYSNSKYRFRFLFPEKWNNQITVEKRDLADVEDSIIFSYLTEDGKEILPIYSIQVYSNEKWLLIEPLMKEKSKVYKVIGKNANYTYIICEENYAIDSQEYKERFNDMKINDSEMKDKFYFIK